MIFRSKKTTSDFRSNPVLQSRVKRPAAVEGNVNSFGRLSESKSPKKPFSNAVGSNRRLLSPRDIDGNAENVGGGLKPGSATAAAADFQEGIDHVENIDFSVAKSVGDPKLIEIEGDFIWFQSSDSATDKLRVRIGRPSNPFLTLLPGQSMGGRRFRRIWLAWAAQGVDQGIFIVSNNHGQQVIVTG
jgi:hypothetical protein